MTLETRFRGVAETCDRFGQCLYRLLVALKFRERNALLDEGERNV